MINSKIICLEIGYTFILYNPFNDEVCWDIIAKKSIQILVKIDLFCDSYKNYDSF